MNLCHLCWHYFWSPKSKSYFCLPCQGRVATYYLDPMPKSFGLAAAIEVSAMLPYRGWFRHYMLQIKVKQDYSCLRGLGQILLSYPQLGCILEGIEVIVPVPSSLWSRLRGRFDVALYLAELLGRRYRIGVVQMGRSHYMWRLRKRALVSAPAKAESVQNQDQNHGRRSNLLNHLRMAFFSKKAKSAVTAAGSEHRLPGANSASMACSSDHMKRVLIIDDIVTTGQSLAFVGSQIKGTHRQYFAVFSALK